MMRPTKTDYGQVFRTTRKNAAARKKRFSLTRQQFKELVKRADGKCEKTGIRFSKRTVNGARRRPYFPSIDRIDNSRGYSKENVRLVIVAYNIGCSEWGDEPLMKIANALVRNEKSKFAVQMSFDFVMRRENGWITAQEFMSMQPERVKHELRYASVGNVAARICKKDGVEPVPVKCEDGIVRNTYPPETLERARKSYYLKGRINR